MDEANRRTFSTRRAVAGGAGQCPVGRGACPVVCEWPGCWSHARLEHRARHAARLAHLFHNAGNNAIVFHTRTWHQSGHHQARDAKGAEIRIDSTHWTTIGQRVPFRLWPGEFVEVIGAGIGVGPDQNDEDWQNARVGSWLLAKAGDTVIFTPASLPVERLEPRITPQRRAGLVA